MPDLGISKGVAKGVRKSVRKGASEAEVKRPGQDDFLGVKTEEPEAEPAVVLDDPAVEPQVAVNEQPTAKVSEEPEVKLASEEEAERLANLNFDDFDVSAKSYHPNYDSLNTTDDVKAILADAAEANSVPIDEARRGKITHEQLTMLAEEMGAPEIVDRVLQRAEGEALNAETLKGARYILRDSATKIKDLSHKIHTGQATDVEKVAFRRQLQLQREFFNEFYTQFMGARAEAGRSLNALRHVEPDEMSLRDIDDIKELIDGVDGYSTEKIAKQIVLADGDTTKITNLARKYTQSKIVGVVNELFVNNILSGPTTHLVNTAGNVMMQMMGFAETAVAARIGKFMGGADHVAVGEASAMMHGTISAFRDAFRLAAQSMKTGVTLDDAVKFESTRRRSISAEHLLTPEQRATMLGGFAETLLDGIKIPTKDGGRRTVVPGAGPLIRTPTERVMAPTDEFFKTLAYRAELERQAFKHAYDQVASGAIDAADAAQVARNFMEDAPLKMQQAAERYTRYVTFQNPLGGRGAAFQMALRKSPITTLIAPFVRTPVNIFTAGILDRSPLGLFRAKFWETMKAGGRDRDMMLARVGMGSATSAVIASLAVDGTVTGAGPLDPAAVAVLEASGWQPYSFRIPNPFTGKVSYHSYARMEPLAFVIGATADTVETMAYLNSDVETLDNSAQKKLNDAAAAIIIGVSNNTMSKTYLQGIADFTQAMADPGRYFQGWSKKFTSAIVPASSFRRSVGKIDDPYMREAWSIIDNMKANSGIPGMSAEFPPRRDIYGNPREWRRGSVLGVMSPMPDKAEKDDPINSQVIALMNLTRRVPITMPARRMEGLRLTEQEYDQVVRTSRTQPMPNGFTFREYLDRIFNSETYQLATPDFKVDMIKEAQSMYDQWGRDELYRNNPEFQIKIDAFQRRRDELKFGD